MQSTQTPTAQSCTVLATSNHYSISRLSGRLVRLWPYSRGLYPRDLPYRLWSIMESDGASQTVFHGTQDAKSAGDLIDFMALFDPAKTILLIGECEADKEFVGFWWYTDIVERFRATGSVFCRRKYRGYPAREGTYIALDYAFFWLGYESVWASTPWLVAARHAKACGFREIALMPSLTQCNSNPRDVHVLRITKEDFACLPRPS